MVDRGLAALAMVTDIIAGRIPKFIEESQLEPAQGQSLAWICFAVRLMLTYI